MGIVDIYSKRQKRLRGDVPDVYRYDEIPEPLRIQILQLLKVALGDKDQYFGAYTRVHGVYEQIVTILCTEYGMFVLNDSAGHGVRDYYQELFDFIYHENDIERVLDAVELSFRCIERYVSDSTYLHRSERRNDEIAARVVDELNQRFKEHGVGYQYNDGEIIRVDSELIHAEAVKPAITLLSHQDYQGAQEEFFHAYDHYRHGNHREALNECLKAFESTMKIICDRQDWKYAHNATANALIQVCFDNGLVDIYWQAQFNALKSLLQSGVPTGRNRLSGHGQGSEIVEVPDFLVSYMLHMTASSIVFLVSAEQAL